MTNATHTAALSVSSRSSSILVRSIDAPVMSKRYAAPHIIPRACSIEELLAELVRVGWEIVGPVRPATESLYYVDIRPATHSG